MKDEYKLKLLPLVEKQMCGILIENGICEYIDIPKLVNTNIHNKFTNMRVLEPYASNIGYEEISREFIKKLRKLYPPQSSRIGTIGTIQKKLRTFLSNNPQYTKEDVYNVIDKYATELIYTGETRLLFSLDNIFYKKEYGVNKSPIEGLFNKYHIDDINNITSDSNDSELFEID